VTKKTSMRCAAWNTVITMLLLCVWEVELGGGRWRWRRWRVWEVEVGGEEERERREGRGEMVREQVCKIYIVMNNKANKLQ